MPQIEDLHTTSKVAAPGWGYVIDTGFDPSKAPINPTNRKRQRTGQTDETSASDLTLRQQTAIQRYFANLDRDNHKTQLIPLPKSRLPDRKQTTNVKRILQSGKDFAYFLEEEEALQSQRGPAMMEATPAIPKSAVQRSSKTPIARRKSLGVPDVATEGTASTSTALIAADHKDQATKPSKTKDATLVDPAVLPTVTDAEIQALLALPPLTYNAARSEAPSASAPRPRVFCEICGYWGRVKCLKCGSRVCSLACKDTHDESRCVKFYA